MQRTMQLIILNTKYCFFKLNFTTKSRYCGQIDTGNVTILNLINVSETVT